MSTGKENVFKLNQNTQIKELNKLLTTTTKNNNPPIHQTLKCINGKWVYNLSSKPLSPGEKSLLQTAQHLLSPQPHYNN